jgi:hypothetical protein
MSAPPGLEKKERDESADALAGVTAVIAAFDESTWEEIHLDTGNVTIRLSTKGGTG